MSESVQSYQQRQQNDVNMSLSLTLDTFHTLLWCFHNYFDQLIVGWDKLVNISQCRVIKQYCIATYVLLSTSEKYSKKNICEKYQPKGKQALPLKFSFVWDFHRSSSLEVFCKKVFLEISQHSQENTSARVFFNKFAGLMSVTLKKRL